MTALAIALLTVAIWAYLLAMRGGFWRAHERDDLVVITAHVTATRARTDWPTVVAVVPARDEAALIGTTVRSLLAQAYAGELHVIVVDDHSSDGTAGVARDAAMACAVSDRLTVLSAPDLASGWTGKLSAMNAGAAHAAIVAPNAAFVWFSDADISYDPDTVSALVAHAEKDGLALTSLMAKLRCESLSERALIPAFIFFFQMLYPFAWVNDASRATAAAAGGCMLVRRKALNDAGGLNAIRGALIDDCAMGRMLKHQGPIWLGLSNRARSLRPVEGFSDLRRMISRSAYAQLRYSPLMLLAVCAGMLLTYLAPPALAFFGRGWAQWAGVAAWTMMTLALQPTLVFYGVSRWWGVVLPLIAAVYLGFTLDSAWQHWRGKGGLWKGRTYVPAPDRR